LELFGPSLLRQVIGFLEEQLKRVSNADIGGILTIGIVGAIWSSSAAVVAIIGSQECPSSRARALDSLVATSAGRGTPPCDLRHSTSAQKVEHYEMASHGTARTYAQVLGEPRVARLLQDALEEEKKADAKLTEIADGKVNE
jgi:hypothetical protein